MAGDLTRPSNYPVPLSPDELRRRSFTNSFRGYDQGEVRELIDAVAVELERLIRSEEALRAELKEARQSANQPRMDEASLTAALGREAAQILHSAHQAAAEARQRAEDAAGRMVREAQQQADAVRSTSDSLLAQRTAEAEAAAEVIRRAARADGQATVTRAREQAEASLSEARARFDAMAEEAEALKSRMLGELTRRRRTIVAQVEQLGAGRDSMLRAVGEVRRLIDQATGSLEGLESEAKAAADNALDRARRSPDIEEPVLDELDRAGIGAAALGPPPPPQAAREVLPGPQEVEAVPAGQDLETAPVPEPPPALPPIPDEETPANVSPAPLRIHAQLAGVKDTADNRAALSPTPPAPPTLAPTRPVPSTEWVTAAAAHQPPEVTRPSEAAPSTGQHPSGGLESEPSSERRMSSLRILRRRDERRHPSESTSSEPTRSEPAPSESASSVPPDEGVRIIRPGAATPEVATPEVVAPEAPEPDPAGEPQPVTATQPPPAMAAPSPPAPVPQPPAAAVTEQVEPESEVSDPAPESAAAADDSTSDRPSVDELFARLRAEREAARQEAEAVLATLPSGPSAEPDADGAEAGTPAGQADPAPLTMVDGPPEEHRIPEAERDDESVPTDEADSSLEHWLARRNQLLAPVHDRLARRLKRTLQDDQNGLLDRARSRTGHPHPDPLPPDAEHSSRFTEAAAPILDDAFARGREFAHLALPGSNGGGGDTGGGTDQAVSLAADLVSELRTRLGRALAEPGLDEAGLADSVGSVYRYWKGARIEALAMDHVVAAFGQGLLSAAPSQARLVWMVDDDGGPCPDCDDNGLAGATPAGSDYPTGQTHPPAHPGCRCLLVPALT